MLAGVVCGVVERACRAADTEPMRHLQNLQCASHDRETNRRVKGRVVCMGLECSHGRVDDLSSGGLRLITRRRGIMTVGAEAWVTLRGDDLQAKLPARVVWVRRHGFVSHLVGLEWVDTETYQDALTALVKYVSRENATAWRPAA